jgi:hypothetical protein
LFVDFDKAMGFLTPQWLPRENHTLATRNLIKYWRESFTWKLFSSLICTRMA